MVTVHQNAPAPRTLDEKVNQLLAKARSPMGEGEARDIAEMLERMLDSHYPVSLRTRRRCFRGLVKLCGERGILPNSYIVPESKLEKLGEGPITTGGFADVWAGVYEDETMVAIKVIRPPESGNSKRARKNFCREVITWKRLSHPNILELIGVTMNDCEFAMVSPWMEHGSITTYVREYPEVNSLKLLEDAARGLEYLHSMELVHGDLKGANILISEDGRACLTDVGLVRIAGDPSFATAMTNTSTVDGGCTVRWSAPEILDPDRFGLKRGGPTKKSDVYSMGMTIYEVLTDKIPFQDEKEVTVMILIGQGVRPRKPNFLVTRGYTQELWEMTMSCWSEQPTERPKAGGVLGVLKVAAERWELRNTSQDNWSPAHCAESDSHVISGPEGGNTSTDAFNSSSHTLVTKTPVPSTTPSSSIPPSLTPQKLSSAPKNPTREGGQPASLLETQPVQTPTSWRKGIIESEMIPPNLIPVAPTEKEANLALVDRCIRPVNDQVEVCEEDCALLKSCMIHEPKVRKLDVLPVSSGGLSRVWAGEYGEERQAVAIKVLRERGSHTQLIKKDFFREAITWKQLSHPNILPLIGVTLVDKEYAMISPWMGGGTIVKFLKKNDCNPLELLHDAGCGLKYLHSMGLIHGDLKGANILVSEDGRACLGDFGLTRSFSDLNSTTATTGSSTCTGTFRWCPPESLHPNWRGPNVGGPTNKSDIYSMAMTIYEVLTGAPPFRKYGKPAAMRNIIEGRRPSEPNFSNTRGYTPELWEVTTQCWKEEPDERPTIDCVLKSLKIAAGLWKPGYGGDWARPPSDDSDQTFSTEESDSPTSPEPDGENGHPIEGISLTTTKHAHPPSRTTHV